MHSIYDPDDEYKAAASQKRLSATTPTGDDTQPNPDNTENVTIALVIGTTATDTQRSLSQDNNEDSRLVPFTKENKLLSKGDDTDLSPTV